MICVNKCYGNKKSVCKYCGDCEHICGNKCRKLSLMAKEESNRLVRQAEIGQMMKSESYAQQVKK